MQDLVVQDPSGFHNHPCIFLGRNGSYRQYQCRLCGCKIQVSDAQLSDRGTLGYAMDKIEEFLGLATARILDGNNVLFRDTTTGRFAFSTDIWTYFRENYEELKASGAFS